MNKPGLRLVASRQADRGQRPGPELRSAIAGTIAARFRGMWVPAAIGSAGILKLLHQHVTDVRGFAHPDDAAAIVVEAIKIIAEKEAAAADAFRRLPRRRRSRIVSGEQFVFEFRDAA